MFPLGFFVFTMAAFLVDCAVKNRAPIATLEAIIADPKHMRDILNGTAGTGYQSTFVRNADGFAANSTGGFGGVDGAPALGDLLGGPLQNPGSGKAEKALGFARSQVGKPYRWGATGPNAYDCSGLMYAAYKFAGVNIPRTTAGQVIGGKPVSRSQLLPGDLVFPYPGHVFMYAGNGNVIEAPHTGTNVHETNLYKFWKARRYA